MRLKMSWHNKFHVSVILCFSFQVFPLKVVSLLQIKM